jgi:hypothetical protein
VVLSELLSAYTLRPTRAEPLYELALYYRGRKNYAMASLFAKAGVVTLRPDDRLFVAENVYTWRLHDELGVAAYWVGDFATCKRSCEVVLERIERGLDVPDAEVSRIRQNLAEANAKIAGK